MDVQRFHQIYTEKLHLEMFPWDTVSDNMKIHWEEFFQAVIQELASSGSSPAEVSE